MRLGVITLVVMALISAATFNLSKFPGFRGTTYYAEFSDASGIHKGNIVQVGGIRVGRVSDVTLDEDRVIVKFEIDDGDVDFGPDSTASIEVLNLLGEKFLDLQPSTEGQLESGGTIPLDNTEAAYDIVGVFGDLTTTTEEIDTQQLSEALERRRRRRWTTPLPRSPRRSTASRGCPAASPSATSRSRRSSRARSRSPRCSSAEATTSST